MRLRMIHEYESRVGEGVKGIRFYELDFKGFKIASERGVRFHMGNRYLSHRKKVELEVTESSEDVKRILAGNMIVLNLLMNYGKIETFGVMETLRPVLDGSIMDGCIIRTAANAIIDKDSILLFEVIRSTPNSMQKLSDKVQRYYTLLDNPIYLKANFHGHVALPQLIICGENGEHNRKIDSFLRSSGLWREEDTILYTEDLLNVSGSLRILYELNKDGEKRWYDIPSRMDKRTLKIA